MHSEEVDKLVNEERTFLHEISTPIMVIRLTLENMEASGGIEGKMKDKFDRALRAVATLSESVEARRTHIKKIQGKP